MDFRWDCIVVGGGAAGLSAALVLGRARQRTLVVDANRQSNRAAHGIGGLLGHDGAPPAALYAAGRAELERYPAVEVRDGEVVGGQELMIGDEHGFLLTLADGSSERARRVLLATGMTYDYPAVAGVAERWGGPVFHCPFCHGWEVQDRRLGVLDRGATGCHRALLLRRWSDDVTLYTNGPSELSDEQAAQLRNAGVDIDERQVEALSGPGEALTAVRFRDGSERPCEAVLIAVTLRQRSPLATALGAATAAPTPLAADAIAIDATFKTSVPGLFAAGDVSGSMPSVANAIAAGSSAAAAIVAATIGM